MANKVLFGILTLLIIAIVILFGINLFIPLNLTGYFANTEDVSSKIENLYELINPGVDVSIEKIEDISGIYKILFRAIDVSGTTTFREAYITKDGKLLTENMILVEQSITQINKIMNFVDCLASKNLRIAGVTNHTATVLQFNVLGGSYATKLYLSCDGQLAQQCVDANITQVPTTVYENKGYPGVQSIQFFENLTACKF